MQPVSRQIRLSLKADIAIAQTFTKKNTLSAFFQGNYHNKVRLIAFDKRIDTRRLKP